jgi:hypothetical protein
MKDQFQKERDVILGSSEPVIISVKKKFPFRGEKTYEIKKQPLTYGVVLQITDCFASIGEMVDKSIKGRAKYFHDNEESITKVIAYALNDNPDTEPSKALLKVVRGSMTVIQAIEVFYFIVEQSHIGDFTNAISWTGMKLVAEESEAKQE